MAGNREMAVREEEEALGMPSLLKGFPSLFGGFSELFDDLASGFPMMRYPSLRTTTWWPRVDIHETEKEYVITAAVPGLRKEDIKINVENGVLSISGERKESKEDKSRECLRHEILYGSFRRDFVLPSGIHPEDVKATQKEGLLTVSMPKPHETKSRGISIRVE